MLIKPLPARVLDGRRERAAEHRGPVGRRRVEVRARAPPELGQLPERHPREVVVLRAALESQAEELATANARLKEQHAADVAVHVSPATSSRRRRVPLCLTCIRTCRDCICEGDRPTKSIKVIMLAQEESRRLGHNFVGTEQILLGLIGEGTGIGPKVLKSMGVNLKLFRSFTWFFDNKLHQG